MDNYLFQLSKIAIKAGKKILEIYSKNFNIYIKKDKSPVTEADQYSEQIIINNLKKINPTIPIIAEELASKNKLPNLSNHFKNDFFLVDPLDGTKEFINKRNEFTVNIALIKNTKPIIGIIFAPAINTLYIGDVKQKIASMYILNNSFDLDKPILIKDISKLNITNKPFKILVSRSHVNEKTLSYIKQLKKQYKEIKTLSVGSSLKLCLLAEGKADIYPRFGSTMEWDIAAGHAILEASQGGIKTIHKNKFIYGKQKTNYLNEHFIAYSN